MMDDFDDDLEHGDDDRHEVRGALLDDTMDVLAPSDPIRLPTTATVHDAVQAMLRRRQAGVLVVDDEGRLIGIFTERDVLTRVVGREVDARRTTLGEVMTPRPEALSADHRIAYAVHCMSVAGYRTVPLVDAAGRPTGIVTVTDVIRWLANLFPEAVLNLAPSDTLKRPGEIDGG
jgi:CBS domain-containing protein